MYFQVLALLCILQRIHEGKGNGSPPQAGPRSLQQGNLKSKALSHGIGQREETDQTRGRRDLEKEYNNLRTVVHKQGK